MISDKEEIEKLIQENKYHQSPKNGRPKGITKDQQNSDNKPKGDKKLGRPRKAEFTLFDANKQKLLKELNEQG
jgi:hypothetical protein